MRGLAGYRRGWRLLPAGVADRQLIDGCRSVGPSLPWVVLNIGVRGTHKELALGRGNIWIHRGADIDARVSAFEADPHNSPMPLYFLTFPSAKDPSWPDRYPDRATVDIAGVTSWELFEPFADTAWMRRGPAYEQLKAKLTDELLTQVLRFCPQLQGHIEHVELATPLSFNHFLNRQYGDFMSLAASPQRFALPGLSAHSGIPNLYFSGQDVAAAGVVGAVTGGIIAASAVLGRNVVADLPPSTVTTQHTA